MSRLVLDEQRTATVSELLRVFQQEGVIKEYAIRVARDGLVQLVYRKHQGTALVKWPWVDGGG